jgi:ABC-type transport system involved in cytochrome c biogenesis permease subunit
MPALQSPFFVPHILGYMMAYTLLTRAFFLSLVASHHARVKHFNARAAQMAVTLSFLWGFFFLTLALALGSIWGNEVWGAYWQWDPKEQWSLATWLVYVAALHFPEYHRGRRLLLGLGLLFIFLTLTWSNVIPNCLDALGMPSQWLTLLFPGGMHAYAR